MATRTVKVLTSFDMMTIGDTYEAECDERTEALVNAGYLEYVDAPEEFTEQPAIEGPTVVEETVIGLPGSVEPLVEEPTPVEEPPAEGTPKRRGKSSN